MIIAFPEVKVGSVIEFKYKMERRTDQNLKDWFFQGKIPVRYSEYQINIPQLYHFSVQPTVVDSIEVKEDMKDGLLSTSEGVLNTQVLKKNFIMRNLVGIRNEPFMGSVRDYQQRLEFQLSEIEYSNTNIVKLRTSWEDVIKSLMKDEDFGKQLEWDADAADAVISQAKQLPDAESKMKFLYNYIRKNFSWDGDESIYAMSGVNNVFTKKTGSSGDINLLLVCLLNKAGVKASPILLSTRENGLVNKYYPFIKQFNTVMAFVKLNEQNYILDGTDKVSGYKLMPESIVNTQGFVVDGEKGKWIELVDQKNKYKVMAAIHGEIDEAGIMKGDGLVNCNGYARKQRCEAWLKNKEQFKDDYFTKPYTALKN